MGESGSFEDLEVWQRSKALAVEICIAFRDSRDFGFRDQITRLSRQTTPVWTIESWAIGPSASWIPETPWRLSRVLRVRSGKRRRHRGRQKE